MDWTRPTLEERREIEERWLVHKKLYTMNWNCAGCLPNGEVIDEVHEANGQCENCVTTAYEMHPDYAYWVDVNHKRGRFIDTVIERRKLGHFSAIPEAWAIADAPFFEGDEA
jgi:hypothetical protein